MPLTNDWNLFQVDLSVPHHRFRHPIVVCFWVGEAVGSFAFDDFEITSVPLFSPPPPPPPLLGLSASPPPPGVVSAARLQPHVPRAATPCAQGCNPTSLGLQLHVPRAATHLFMAVVPCIHGCNLCITAGGAA